MTISRIILTPEQIERAHTVWAEQGYDPNDPAKNVIQEGTNLVLWDTLRVCDAFDCVVIGGNVGIPYVYVPDFDLWTAMGVGEECEAVTDRAGPNGETMPVVDTVAMAALQAKKAGANTHPKNAAKEEKREERAHRRDLKALLAAQTPEVEKKLRKALKAHGLLKD